MGLKSREEIETAVIDKRVLDTKRGDERRKERLTMMMMMMLLLLLMMMMMMMMLLLLLLLLLLMMMMMMMMRGRGKKGALARKPLYFEKPVRPRTGLLIGAAWSY